MPSVDLLIKCSTLFDCDVMYLAGYQKDRKIKDSDIPEPIYHEEADDNSLDELQLLTMFLKKKGLLNENEELNEENYNRLIEFVKANKNFIINDKK